MLGISVFRSEAELVTGQQLNGLAVATVDEKSLAFEGGIRAQRIKVGRAAAEVGATVLLLGAAAVFPPAVFGVPLLARMSAPKAYDVIVAVDAERVQDLNELEEHLRNAKTGETIYMTLIRDGRRVQLSIPLPSIVSLSSPSLAK